jgi:hypothetical protein
MLIGGVSRVHGPLARHWSGTGQALARHWPNTGQTLARHWPGTGQGIKKKNNDGITMTQKGKRTRYRVTEL